MSILDEIFRHKREEVERQRGHRPLTVVRAAAEARRPPCDFVAALRRSKGHPALIAEIKRASPSRGRLAPDIDPACLARLYAGNGAAAISVLTELRYFDGSLEDLELVAGLGLGLPLLRKDFISDPYQVYEARAAGADAILLIVAALPDPLLGDLIALARDLGMAALVEVHTAGELHTALRCRAEVVGINNRDLHTFKVSLDTTLALRPLVPPEVALVAESGIHSTADVERLAAARVDAILVGEALVTAPDVAAQVRVLAGRGETCISRSVA